MKPVRMVYAKTIDTRRILVVLIVLALSSLLCLGCSGQYQTKSNTSGSRSYYEGYWVCHVCTENGVTATLGNMSEEVAQAFPFMVIELHAEEPAKITQYNNGDGDAEVVLSDEWSVTENGIMIGEFEFVQDGPDLVSQNGPALMRYEKVIFDSQLNMGLVLFNDILFYAPTDVAYTHIPVSRTSESYGIASSYRSNGPTLRMSAEPTDAQDVVEYLNETNGEGFYQEHADSFDECNGITFFLQNDEGKHESKAEFVAKGKLYSIEFSYKPDDPVDYSTYPADFYKTVVLEEAVYPPEDSGDSQQKVEDTGAPDAIYWQEAYLHVGETITVYGPVADIDYAASSNGQPTFIDLGVAYPDEDRVTIVIWGEDRYSFPDSLESLYSGKTLYVTGEIYIHDGVCNIKVTSPSQIQVA